jgi:hypothetical protein
LLIFILHIFNQVTQGLQRRHQCPTFLSFLFVCLFVSTLTCLSAYFRDSRVVSFAHECSASSDRRCALCGSPEAGWQGQAQAAH